MLDLKCGIVLAGLAAVGANLPEAVSGEGTGGIIRSLIGLGATGVIAALMWRQIEVLGKAIARNTDATDRMREHCSAKNGEAPDRRKDGDA